MKKLKLATSNKNKLREVSEILGYELESIDIDLEEIQAIDVIEVSKSKAIEGYKKMGFSVLVEDTSLSIDAWGGLPGALIKWFMQTVDNDGIIKMLGSEKNRGAVAKTVFAYADENGVHIFEGEIKGRIAKEARGENGFGWDRIFIPLDSEITFAEMSSGEKNKFSMRKLALDKFL